MITPSKEVWVRGRVIKKLVDQTKKGKERADNKTMGASCEGSKNRWDRSEGTGKQKTSEGKM